MEKPTIEMTAGPVSLAASNYFTPSWPVTLTHMANLKGHKRTIVEVLHRDGPQTADHFHAPPFSIKEFKGRVTDLNKIGFDIRSSVTFGVDPWGRKTSMRLYTLRPSSELDFALAEDDQLSITNKHYKMVDQIVREWADAPLDVLTAFDLILERLTAAKHVGTARVIAEHRGVPPDVTIH